MNNENVSTIILCCFGAVWMLPYLILCCANFYRDVICIVVESWTDAVGEVLDLFIYKGRYKSLQEKISYHLEKEEEGLNADEIKS